VKLRQVSITGYRSIRETLPFDLDDRVTVVLGANDHGKTNVLHAITHLNADTPFEAERDLNWDYHDRGSKFPRIDYKLVLSDSEREALFKEENAWIRTSAISEFRKSLAEAAAEAESAATTAKGESDEAAARAAELEAAGTDPPAAEAAAEEAAAEVSPAAPNAAALSAAKAEASDKLQLAEEAAERAAVARKRVALGAAEEMQLRAMLDGEDGLDIVAIADEAEAAAGRAATNAKSAQTRSETAEATKTQAAETHPAGSEELTKAEQDAENAASRAKAAVKASDDAAREAARLRVIADAVTEAEQGNLSFAKEAPLPEPTLRTQEEMPTQIVLTRAGVEGQLAFEDAAGLDHEALLDFVLPRLPRVELISPQESLPDVATRETIRDENNDFMRGIFRYAGLEENEWDSIFEQSNRTTKRLDKASEQLNTTLRDAWSQGKNLGFKLDHDQGEIHLRLDDPAVDVSYARASRRSSGFTHFFALKTVLYARERASEASSLIWLFDDPGIYLHPAGQHDLLQVVETLSRSNQVVYSTHSIFLINKNYPTRHRLLKKDGAGTGIDQKPFAGQWRAAIDALGLAFPGTVLFASKVLLVEGDSDPILINSDLQKLIELGDFTFDINPLSIMATGDSKHADALTRILLDSAVRPKIAFLFDGDKGGSDRRKNLKRLIEAKKLEEHTLPKNTTGEDYVLSPGLFREATIIYIESLCENAEKKDKKPQVRPELEKSYNERFGSGDPKGLAAWSREEGKRVLETTEEPSSVGIAREYNRLLAETDPEKLPPKTRKRAIELAKEIAAMLELPSQLAEQGDILEAS